MGQIINPGVAQDNAAVMGKLDDMDLKLDILLGTLGENVFGKLTLSAIQKVIAAGKAEEYFHVGDEITINIGRIMADTGGTLHFEAEETFVIAGFNHDDLAGGSGKASITLLSKMGICLAVMNETATNVGGWQNSYARTNLMPKIKAAFPQEWQGAMKTVNKKTSSGNKSATIQTTQDDVFILSHAEVMGTCYRDASTRLSYDCEGEQYDIFKNAPLPSAISECNMSEYDERIITPLSGTSGTYSCNDYGYYTPTGASSKKPILLGVYNNTASVVIDENGSYEEWNLRSPVYNSSTDFAYVAERNDWDYNVHINNEYDGVYDKNAHVSGDFVRIAFCI